jgi:predicted O-linked N-acetylglucosamine transferase (SPINDLY family)
VLTRLGQSFAGRVSSSLVNSAGLQELITTSEREYESLAIDLGNNPDKLRAIKLKLKSNSALSPLFNTAIFTHNIEAAYKEILKRHQLNMKPDHIFI